MGISFPERYNQEQTWHGKVLVMEIYHLAMSHLYKDWNLSKTAQQFNCSIGLVSENLKLANAIHANQEIVKCKYRDQALTRLRKGMYASSMEAKRPRITSELD